ncbi:50S ribosomal protein L9 [Patescibacteria group bacterium]|nr:50S ribosomal protein L9 [Patescibacteria group bacterium]
MKVVMLMDVKKVGQRGAVVEVADGYAMNVLIPKKQAAPATAENLKRVEREALAAKGKKDMDAMLAKKALEQIDGKTITIHAKANPAGGLFESIKEKQINEAIEKEFGISLPESAIKLDEPIKKAGVHPVSVSLQGAKATVTLSISS